MSVNAASLARSRARAQLGPTARAVLEEVRSDPQKEVRELATRALAGGS